MLGLPKPIVPKKWRRLWRRRLRRRPLLPFLLAATLAVDLALRFLPIDWERENLVVVVLSGFLASQLGLVGTWITHAKRGILRRMGLAIIALCFTFLTIAIFAAEHRVVIIQDPNSAGGVVERLEIVSSGIVEAVTSLMVIFSVIATGGVQLVCRLIDSRLTSRSKQRITISSLLWVTLIVTLLLGLGRYAAWDSVAEPQVLPYLLAEAVVTAVMLSVAIRFPQWPWRHLLLVLGPIAAVVGISAFFLQTDRVSLLPLYYAVQCFFLGAWYWLLNVGAVIGQQRLPKLETLCDPVKAIDLSA